MATTTYQQTLTGIVGRDGSWTLVGKTQALITGTISGFTWTLDETGPAVSIGSHKAGITFTPGNFLTFTKHDGVSVHGGGYIPPSGLRVAIGFNLTLASTTTENEWVSFRAASRQSFRVTANWREAAGVGHHEINYGEIHFIFSVPKSTLEDIAAITEDADAKELHTILGQIIDRNFTYTKVKRAISSNLIDIEWYGYWDTSGNNRQRHYRYQFSSENRPSNVNVIQTQLTNQLNDWNEGRGPITANRDLYRDSILYRFSRAGRTVESFTGEGTHTYPFGCWDHPDEGLLWYSAEGLRPSTLILRDGVTGVSTTTLLASAEHFPNQVCIESRILEAWNRRGEAEHRISDEVAELYEETQDIEHPKREYIGSFEGTSVIKVPIAVPTPSGMILDQDGNLIPANPADTPDGSLAIDILRSTGNAWRMYLDIAQRGLENPNIPNPLTQDTFEGAGEVIAWGLQLAPDDWALHRAGDAIEEGLDRGILQPIMQRMAISTLTLTSIAVTLRKVGGPAAGVGKIALQVVKGGISAGTAIAAIEELLRGEGATDSLEELFGLDVGFRQPEIPEGVTNIRIHNPNPFGPYEELARLLQQSSAAQFYRRRYGSQEETHPEEAGPGISDATSS